MEQTAVQELEQFLTKCKEKSHYWDLHNPGDKFKGWQDNKALMQDYAKWIAKESNCPSLVMNIDVPYKQMALEAECLIHRFVKHRGEWNPGWSSLTIHGQSAERTQPPHWYIDHGYDTEETSPPVGWTDIAEQCPVTVEWLRNTWPFKKYNRVRYMLLEPGGYIQPHHDFDTRALAAFNVALSNPPGVEFALEESGLIPWEPGDARAIDIGRDHAVYNKGTENRIHMIIHGLWGDDMPRHMCESFDALLINIAANNN